MGSGEILDLFLKGYNDYIKYRVEKYIFFEVIVSTYMVVVADRAGSLFIGKTR